MNDCRLRIKLPPFHLSPFPFKSETKALSAVLCYGFSLSQRHFFVSAKSIAVDFGRNLIIASKKPSASFPFVLRHSHFPSNLTAFRPKCCGDICVSHRDDNRRQKSAFTSSSDNLTPRDISQQQKYESLSLSCFQRHIETMLEDNE